MNGQVEDKLYFRVRSDRNGGDFRGPAIEQTGWWTLGLSFTPDGVVHYFAKPGVEDLTREDYIASLCLTDIDANDFERFFYNVVNNDDGRTWSTSFVVDDPKVFVLDATRTAKR